VRVRVRVRVCVGGVGDRRVGRSHCRTFPGHSFLGTERGTAALRRVLVAYARHNPALGYCQSMNLLCGILLLFLDDEAAFWVLEALLLHIMPAGYYSHSMDAAVADQSVFADLVLERLPHVHMHLRRLGVELRLISMEWFLCLFSSTFEPSAALRECGRPSPGADVAGAGPSPGADVAGASPVLVQMWQCRFHCTGASQLCSDPPQFARPCAHKRTCTLAQAHSPAAPARHYQPSVSCPARCIAVAPSLGGSAHRRSCALALINAHIRFNQTRLCECGTS
jgi:hypothetical protein